MFRNNSPTSCDYCSYTIVDYYIFQGRSFAFQQIRKMVGLIVCIVSGRADEDLFVRSFSKSRVDIPVASSSGILK